MKTILNGSHLDLAEISMIGPLVRVEGQWVFGVMWKRTGTTSNVSAVPEQSHEEKYSLSGATDQKPAAEEAYAKFLKEWHGL